MASILATAAASSYAKYFKWWKANEDAKSREANKIIAGHCFERTFYHAVYLQITKKGDLAKQFCHTGLRVLLKRVSHMFFNVAHAISQGGMTGLHDSTIKIKVFENWNWKEGIEENAFCYTGSYDMQRLSKIIYIMLKNAKAVLSRIGQSVGGNYTIKNSHKDEKDHLI